jgi:predicted nuclease of predicted toxin-antitoxin system
MATKNRIRFYLDENVDKQVAVGLRTRGVDVQTPSAAGNLGREDQEHLVYARDEGRVIITQDADFLRLHAQGQHHAGIVYYKPQTRTIKQILRRLLLIYEVLQSEDMQDHIEYL